MNVATHSLGVLVSSLCGCLHSGHVSVCAMRGVPAVCTFPYNVYAKAFAGSAQVWEAVKASTATCILHGDAGLLKLIDVAFLMSSVFAGQSPFI